MRRRKDEKNHYRYRRQVVGGGGGKAQSHFDLGAGQTSFSLTHHLSCLVFCFPRQQIYLDDEAGRQAGRSHMDNGVGSGRVTYGVGGVESLFLLLLFLPFLQSVLCCFFILSRRRGDRVTNPWGRHPRRRVEGRERKGRKGKDGKGKESCPIDIQTNKQLFSFLPPFGKKRYQTNHITSHIYIQTYVPQNHTY